MCFVTFALTDASTIIGWCISTIPFYIHYDMFSVNACTLQFCITSTYLSVLAQRLLYCWKMTDLSESPKSAIRVYGG
jgi:predicted membrane-bound dolichyl-phosphate-mannose-protein mannosyltransferase